MELAARAAASLRNTLKTSLDDFRAALTRLKEKSRPHISPLPAGARWWDTRVLTATWFGAGRLRPAPGTMGSIAAIPFGYAIYAAGGPFALFVSAFGLLYVGTLAADYYGGKSGVKDDQSIVVDEVAGMWLAATPAENHWDLWLFALLLFRLFDIVKPWPASYYDKRSADGYDVMMDDIVAGVYALVGVGGAACYYL
jgi:phosphatidylglycerophosphatase A